MKHLLDDLNTVSNSWVTQPMEGRGREGGGGGGKVGGWGAQTIEKIGFYTTQRTTIGQKETKTTGGPPPPLPGGPQEKPKK